MGAGCAKHVKSLEYDLYYIKHMSPALDAYIVLHTLIEMPFRAE